MISVKTKTSSERRRCEAPETGMDKDSKAQREVEDWHGQGQQSTERGGRLAWTRTAKHRGRWKTGMDKDSKAQRERWKTLEDGHFLQLKDTA